MTSKLHFNTADLIGFGRLANDATAGIVDVAEAVHRQVAFSGGPPQVEECRAGITALVYNSIRTVTTLLGAGFQSMAMPFQRGQNEVSPQREAVLAALNGVLGDYLVRTNNPLSIVMSLRRHGRQLELERHALQEAISNRTGKLLLLAHGLCLNDLQWKRNGHDHGASLARETGYTPLYLHYNSGLHVSENGRLLATLVENLVEEWPVKVRELVMVGHSMGGLVLRSALHYGNEAGLKWPQPLRKLIFLGTPHHGAPLEQLGSWVDHALESNPYTVPFASVGKIRSAGITDMRHGALLDEDWNQRDRFAASGDVRASVPLPKNVQCYAIAATRQKQGANAKVDCFGDGLVPVSSALGRHANPSMNLRFSESHTWVGYGINHWDLLSHSAVYERIRAWIIEEH